MGSINWAVVPVKLINKARNQLFDKLKIKNRKKNGHKSRKCPLACFLSSDIKVFTKTKGFDRDVRGKLSKHQISRRKEMRYERKTLNMLSQVKKRDFLENYCVIRHFKKVPFTILEIHDKIFKLRKFV